MIDHPRPPRTLRLSKRSRRVIAEIRERLALGRQCRRREWTRGRFHARVYEIHPGGAWGWGLSEHRPDADAFQWWGRAENEGAALWTLAMVVSARRRGRGVGLADLARDVERDLTAWEDANLSEFIDGRFEE